MIRNHVAVICREVLIKEYGETIREKIKESLANKLSNDFIDRICEKASEKYY